MRSFEHAKGKGDTDFRVGSDTSWKVLDFPGAGKSVWSWQVLEIKA